jgi:nucleoside-diphosphate-sugar epimerase
MRALVTGGAGFIGSALARGLLEQHHRVRILDNLLTGFEGNVPNGAEFIRGDLRNLEVVRDACSGVDVVFHQAALGSVRRSLDDPVLTESCNVTGTLNVLIAASEASVRRLVYASSSSVYGELNGAKAREDLRPAPLSPYAVSKLAGEHYCRAWTQIAELSTVSLRYFNVFGPGQHPDSKYSAVFPAFASALALGRAPEIHWDGEQARDFTYIEDVVRANMLAAEADGPVGGEVINIGSGRPRSVKEVLSKVSESMGVWIPPVRTPKRPWDVRLSHADIHRARDLLGWEPQAEWGEAVTSTVRWFASEWLALARG